MIRRLPPTLVTIVPVPSERASETTAIADDGERAIAITPQNNATTACSAASSAAVARGSSSKYAPPTTSGADTHSATTVARIVRAFERSASG